MAYDENLKREFNIPKPVRTFIPQSTYSRFLNKNLFMCKCGWSGTVFETKNITIREYNELSKLLTQQSKEKLFNWNGCLCPKCESNLLSIQEIIQKFRDAVDVTILMNGWSLDNKIFPRDFMFIHKNSHKMTKDPEIEQFKEMIMEKAVVAQNKTGDKVMFKVCLDILPYFELPTVISMAEDIATMLTARIRYLEAQTDIYMEFDMEPYSSNLYDEIEVLGKLRIEFYELIQKRHGR